MKTLFSSLQRASYLVCLGALSVLLSGCQTMGRELNCPSYTGFYFVDAQSQLPRFRPLSDAAMADLVYGTMAQTAVDRTILAPRGGQTHERVLELARRSTGDAMLYPAIATKTVGTEDLRRVVNEASDAYVGLGEVLVYHAAKPELGADEIINYPDEKRVTTAFTLARRKGWPLVLHFEDAGLPNDLRLKMYRRFCRVGFNFIRDLPDDNPIARQMSADDCDSLAELALDMTDDPVVFTHLAQMSPYRVKKLLERYPKLYFMIYHNEATNPVGYPWTPTFKNGHLLPQWEALFTRFPDRFVFTLDNVTERHWRHRYIPVAELWKAAFDRLPSYPADAIAHLNAERLWKLPARCAPGRRDNQELIAPSFP